MRDIKPTIQSNCLDIRVDPKRKLRSHVGLLDSDISAHIEFFYYITS